MIDVELVLAYNTGSLDVKEKGDLNLFVFFLLFVTFGFVNFRLIIEMKMLARF